MAGWGGSRWLDGAGLDSSHGVDGHSAAVHREGRVEMAVWGGLRSLEGQISIAAVV